MALSNISPNNSNENIKATWSDFCEHHASSAAEDFSWHLSQYLIANPSQSCHPYKEKFVELFLHHFQTLSLIPNQNTGDNINGDNITSTNRTRLSSSGRSESELTNEGNDVASLIPSSISHKQNKPSFFRKFSIRNFKPNIRPFKHFFRQNSDEIQLSNESTQSSNHVRASIPSSAKSRKMFVECRKEGLVDRFEDEDKNGQSQWEKCRIRLVKMIGGDLLEFYLPPKSSKPSMAMFCMMMTEVRETSSLEMPDQENTIVIKLEGNEETVLRMKDNKDMKSWMEVLKQSMLKNQPPLSSYSSNQQETLNNTHQKTTPINSSLRKDIHADFSVCIDEKVPILDDHRRLSINSDSDIGDHPPELPPRTPQRTLSQAPLNSICTRSSNSVASLINNHPSGEIQIPIESLEANHMLLEYPWFHGTLSRMEAAQLVLQKGAEGHGVFLVRQSETRKGEYVLTFNFQAKAKHLRMMINLENECHVQHLTFPSIFDTLEHFRIHPIPLESGGSSNISLTEYVIAETTQLRRASGGPSLIEHTPTNISQSSLNRIQWATFTPTNILTPPMAATRGGSVRLRTRSLETVRNDALVCPRAVDNPYSFV